ncbi:MAG: cytochrome C, partial [bacterium]
PFPDLLAFHDVTTPIEHKLFLMFLEYRMRTFQGIFHANPDYAFWYGWSPMVSTLTEIRAMAEEMRKNHKK